MRHFNIPSLFILLLAAQLSLTSCGGGGDSKAAQTSDNGQASADEQAPAPDTPAPDSAPTPTPVGTTFTRTYGGIYIDAAGGARQTSDGGYIIAGRTGSYGAGGSDAYLVKTDPDGNALWSKTFGGTGADAGNSVHETSDGGYIVVGNTEPIGAGTKDVYLVKTGSNGDILWSKTFGGNGGDDGNSVMETSDGGYIIAGETGSYGAGSYDVYLVKTDTNGNALWAKMFGGAGNDDAHSVRQTSDGGYIIAGDTGSFGAGGSDMYLVKTDPNGVELWSKTFGGIGSDYGHSVRQTSDGGYIVSGYTGSFGAGANDVYLVKTDQNGNELWSQAFGGTGTDDGNSVQETVDGGYIIAGVTKSFGEGYDVYLVKTDSNGNVLWAKAFGGSGGDYGYSVQQTADGGYIIAGETGSYGAGGGDIFLIKTDADGNALPY